MLVVMRQYAKAEEIQGAVRAMRTTASRRTRSPARSARPSASPATGGRSTDPSSRACRRTRGHSRHPRLQARLPRGQARGQRSSASGRAGGQAGRRDRAGPCAVEIARADARRGARRARRPARASCAAGPSSRARSPYAFQGLGRGGPEDPRPRPATRPACRSSPRCIDPRDVALVAKYADILQIGARNMQNFSLLSEVGQLGKPVLLKRGMSRDPRGVAELRRVHPRRGQPRTSSCASVGSAPSNGLLPQHAGPRHRAGREGGSRTCPSWSTPRTAPAGGTWWRPLVPGGSGGRRGRAHRRGAPRPPTPHCPTARNRSLRPPSPSSWPSFARSPRSSDERCKAGVRRMCGDQTPVRRGGPWRETRPGDRVPW